MVLLLQLVIRAVTLLSGFIALGIVPSTRKMLKQRRYRKSDAPIDWSQVVFADTPHGLPKCFDFLIHSPPVRAHYSPLSAQSSLRATPSLPVNTPKQSATHSHPAPQPTPTRGQAAASPTAPPLAPQPTPRPAPTQGQATSSPTGSPAFHLVKQWFSRLQVVMLIAKCLLAAFFIYLEIRERNATPGPNPASAAAPVNQGRQPGMDARLEDAALHERHPSSPLARPESVQGG